MKSFILFFGLTAACFSDSFGQNWQPFVLGDTYHYQHLGSAPITETISIDSVVLVNSDSVYYFHEHVEKCDNCIGTNTDDSIFIRNLPHFVGRQMIKKANGEYILADVNSYSLFPASAMGASWQFSPSLMATVSAIRLVNLWGNIDSIKTFLLSNNDSLLLSRNHGIVQFPSFSAAPSYVLAGIPSRSLGSNVPDTKSVYDFAVGDVFFYDNVFNVFGGSISTCWVQEKWALTQKQVYPDSITYTFYIHGKRLCNSSASPYYTRYYTWTLRTTSSTLCDAYQGITTGNVEIPCMVNSTSMYFYGALNTQAAVLYRSSDNLHNDTKKVIMGGELVLDTFTVKNDYRQLIWQNGLGEVFAEANMLEGYTRIHQIGYIKYGVATGQVFDDWYYTDIAEKEVMLFRIYPNPTHDKLSLYYDGNICTFSISTIIGKVIFPLTTLQNSTTYEIPVREWAQGVYFIQVQDEKGNIHTEKFIKE